MLFGHFGNRHRVFVLEAERYYGYILQLDPALGDRAHVELHARGAETHQRGRLRQDDRVDVRVALVDGLVHRDRAARDFAGLDHAVFHLHDIFRFDVPAGHARGGDQEIVASPAYRYGTVSADHQSLVARTTHDATNVGADGALVRRVSDTHEVRIIGGQ